MNAPDRENTPYVQAELELKLQDANGFTQPGYEDLDGSLNGTLTLTTGTTCSTGSCTFDTIPGAPPPGFPLASARPISMPMVFRCWSVPSSS